MPGTLLKFYMKVNLKVKKYLSKNTDLGVSTRLLGQYYGLGISTETQSCSCLYLSLSFLSPTSWKMMRHIYINERGLFPSFSVILNIHLHWDLKIMLKLLKGVFMLLVFLLWVAISRKQLLGSGYVGVSEHVCTYSHCEMSFLPILFLRWIYIAFWDTVLLNVLTALHQASKIDGISPGL